jgi:hypothetical protein
MVFLVAVKNAFLGSSSGHYSTAIIVKKQGKHKEQQFHPPLSWMSRRRRSQV